MPRCGITRESIIKKAAEIIESGGTEDFSMRLLADKLNIKTASLYNHIKNMEELIIEVCSYALNMQKDAELKAIDGLNGASAIIALANSYRLFAKEHKELYILIMNTAASCGDKLSGASDCITKPFLKVLEGYSLSETEKIHWQRILRTIVHGFVSQEYSGFFSHFPADTDETFEMAVNCYICGLQNAEKRRS